MKLITNSPLNTLAKQGHAFHPIEGETGSRSAHVFVRSDRGEFRGAVFNFNAKQNKQIKLDLARIGLNPDLTYRA